jgi:hypothetical protein
MGLGIGGPPDEFTGNRWSKTNAAQAKHLPGAILRDSAIREFSTAEKLRASNAI